MKLLTGMMTAGMALACALTCGTARADTAPAPSAEWANKTVPPSVFAQFSMIKQPRLSPDGKWTATTIRMNGEQRLAILPVHPEDGKLQIIATNGEASSDKQDDRQVVGYHWADSNHLIIAFSSRVNLGDGWFDNIRYISFNRTANKITALGWDLAFGPTKELWSSRTGRPHILLQRLPYNIDRDNDASFELIRNPEVIDVDLDTGKYTVVMRQNAAVQDWTADSNGVVRMGQSRDAETGRVSVLYRAGADQPMTMIYNAVPDRYTEHALPDYFLAGSNKAYAVSREDGYAALYEYDLAAMKLGRKVFGVPGYDIEGPAMLSDRTALLGVNYISDRNHWVYFDPRMKDIQASLERIFGAGNVLIATTDAARETIVFRVARLGQAESWYTFDTKMGGIARFAWGNDTLKDAVLNPVSVVQYPTSDGKKIEAVLTMPRHRVGEKNLPLVILPHGGPWARDEADWDPYGWAQALAEQGYVVIQPNYRGSTGYGAAWEKASEQNWGYRMQDDLNDAIPWLAGQGIVDAKRVCMMGLVLWRLCRQPRGRTRRRQISLCDQRSRRARSRRDAALRQELSRPLRREDGHGIGERQSGRCVARPAPEQIFDSHPHYPGREGSARSPCAIARSGRSAQKSRQGRGQGFRLCRAAAQHAQSAARAGPDGSADRDDQVPEGAQPGVIITPRLANVASRGAIKST